MAHTIALLIIGLMSVLLSAADHTQIYVAFISLAGVVVVALIGLLTAVITRASTQQAKSAQRSAESSKEEAGAFAAAAADYAAALTAKDALIDAQEDRIDFLEVQDRRCQDRLQQLEQRVVEHDESIRAAALLEREYIRQIDELEHENAAFKRRRRSSGA